MSTPSLRPSQRPPSTSVGADVFGPHESPDQGASAAWSIISYILSGILFWGILGRLVDGWLFDQADTTAVFLPLGVIVGTAAGGYLGYMKYLQATADHVPPLTSATE